MRRPGKVLVSGALVILIIAAGCFVFYKPSSKADTLDPESSLHSFVVHWDIKQTSLLNVADFVDKKAGYTKTISFQTPNLKDIILRLRWTDDTTLFGFFGRDTLTLTVITPNGIRIAQSARCTRNTRQGLIELTIPVKQSNPDSQVIQATDILSAGVLLETSFDYTWVDTEFTVQISDVIGELRPLKRLQDLGNDFTLEITSRYYHATFIDETNTAGTGNESEDTIRETGFIPPSACPFCDGGMTHKPWCPYYEDPFEDDFFNDDDSYRDPWEDDHPAYQPIPWDKPGRVILLYLMFLMMMYLSQIWVFGGIF
jgi:hypothetical protein